MLPAVQLTAASIGAEVRFQTAPHAVSIAETVAKSWLCVGGIRAHYRTILELDEIRSLAWSASLRAPTICHMHRYVISDPRIIVVGAETHGVHTLVPWGNRCDR